MADYTSRIKDICDSLASIEVNIEEGEMVQMCLGGLALKFASTEKASTSANERLRRSTHQKNPVMRFRYNEYMAQHYAYMTRVAEVREPESYAEAAKDAKWHAAMEEEMHALAENKTWDLVDAPKGVKSIGPWV